MTDPSLRTDHAPLDPGRRIDGSRVDGSGIDGSSIDPAVRTDPGSGGLRALPGGMPISPELSRRWLQALYETPLLYSGILDAHGRLLDGNRLAIEGCGYVREQVLGQVFWEGGWWAPDPRVAAQVRQWCEQCLSTGEALRVRHEYFVADGTRRAVDLAFSPVVDRSGGVSYLVVSGLDITDAELATRERQRRLDTETQALRTAELQLAYVERQQARAVQRLEQLVDATLAFAAANTIDELVNDVVERAVNVLGADAGMVAVRSDDWLTVTASASLDHLPDWSQPLDSDLPMAHVARTGTRLLLPTRAARAAFSANAGRRYGETGRDAWAFFPLSPGGRLLGSLAVGWREEREVSDDEVSLLEAFSAQCGQALERIQHQQAERTTAQRVARLAEALQVSLLTRPPTPDGLEIAVRYQPAAELAKVGGDFYDAFVDASGATVIAVGDIAGHDTAAAAAMAQIRNLLRGLAYDTDDSPADVLRRLDIALAGLRVSVLATALLARIGPPGVDGQRRLVWSSAGHPPPLLREPGGAGARVLYADPGVMLGVHPGSKRTDATVPLAPGSMLLLYTDGLVERRDEDLDRSIQALRALLARTGDQSAEHTCDTLLRQCVTGGDDDIAMLAVRVRG
jgi:PAS domain S-box-containing protein